MSSLYVSGFIIPIEEFLDRALTTFENMKGTKDITGQLIKLMESMDETNYYDFIKTIKKFNYDKKEEIKDFMIEQKTAHEKQDPTPYTQEQIEIFTQKEFDGNINEKEKRFKVYYVDDGIQKYIVIGKQITNITEHDNWDHASVDRYFPDALHFMPGVYDCTD